MNKLFAAVSVVFMLMSSCTIGQTKYDIELDEFEKKMASEKYLLVDVRTAEEFAEEHIKGAINIDYLAENFSIEIQELELESPVLLYCRSGNRSSKAMKIMNELGFKEVYNLEGGIKGWISENNPVITE
jgi:rhodanese-related sulfurtransferase